MENFQITNINLNSPVKGRFDQFVRMIRPSDNAEMSREGGLDALANVNGRVGASVNTHNEDDFLLSSDEIGPGNSNVHDKSSRYFDEESEQPKGFNLFGSMILRAIL